MTGRSNLGQLEPDGLVLTPALEMPLVRASEVASGSSVDARNGQLGGIATALTLTCARPFETAFAAGTGVSTISERGTS